MASLWVFLTFRYCVVLPMVEKTVSKKMVSRENSSLAELSVIKLSLRH
jgi:hypothetical protein